MITPPAAFSIQDLQFEAFIKFASEDWDFPVPKSSDLASVADAFRANAAGIRLLALLPTQINGLALKTQRAHDMAELEIMDGLRGASAISQEEERKIEARREEILKEFEQHFERKKGTPEWDQAVVKFHLDAAQSLNGLAGNPIGALSIYQMFPVSAVSAWTAIETMLGDLWEAALNCHPATLAALKGAPKRIAKSAYQAANETKASDSDQKLVPLHLIEMNKFDLRSCMGTVFRQQRRFEFTRLSSIREAYSCAFAEKSSPIDTALSQRSLDALSAVRNVIVHKGGYVDAEYIRHTKNLKIPKADIGRRIRLSGETTATLIRDALSTSKSLFIAVDDWIHKN